MTKQGLYTAGVLLLVLGYLLHNIHLDTAGAVAIVLGFVIKPDDNLKGGGARVTP